jgi:hypothetical protein
MGTNASIVVVVDDDHDGEALLGSAEQHIQHLESL